MEDDPYPPFMEDDPYPPFMEDDLKFVFLKNLVPIHATV